MTPGFVALVDKARSRLHLPAESVPVGRWAGVVGFLAPRIGEAAASDIESVLTQSDTLFSPSYFQYCLRLVIESVRQGEGDEHFVAQFAKQNRNLLYPDGSLQWCEVFLVQTPEDIRRSTGKAPTEQIVAESVRPIAETPRCSRRLSTTSCIRESKSSSFCRRPTRGSTLRQKTSLQKSGKTCPTAETEAYLRGFAKQHGIRVRGSYDPQRAGVTESDFVDLVHLRREAIDRIWTREVPTSSK